MDAKGYDVIDRNHLKSILAEHKLSLLGLIDPNTVKKIGQLSGVDALITGTVTPFGDSIRVTCKVIATDTAKVIGAAKNDIAKTKAIEELLVRGISTPDEGSSPASQHSTLTPSQVSQKVESKGFVVELKSCNSVGDEVKCALAITSVSSKEVRVTLAGYKSYLSDESGNQYKAKAVSFGGNEGSVTTVHFLPQTPEHGYLLFRDVPVVTKSASLGFAFNSPTGGDVKMVFRNVVLNK
jgi:hypothetical protein